MKISTHTVVSEQFGSFNFFEVICYINGQETVVKKDMPLETLIQFCDQDEIHRKFNGTVEESIASWNTLDPETKAHFILDNAKENLCKIISADTKKRLEDAFIDYNVTDVVTQHDTEIRF